MAHLRALEHSNPGDGRIIFKREFSMRQFGLVYGAVISTIALAFVSGCAPRGESHTVDEILTDARTGYMTVFASRAGDYKEQLKGLTASLDKLAGIGGGGDARSISGGIAESLQALIDHAGFTVRPAMGELINQYRVVATNGSRDLSIGAPNLKLLVARTYTLISSELKTTQFKIS